MRQVRLSTNAETDLLSILDYWAVENPAVAVRIVDRLQKSSAELAERALLYPLVPNHEASGVRRRVAGNYGVFYIVREDYVEVLQILHAARDSDSVLFPED